MPWIITTGRPSGRFEPVDTDDDEYPLNGFACVAQIHAFSMRCLACGTLHEVRAEAARPRAFNRQNQRFRCRRCPFRAEVRLTVDCGFAYDPRRAAAQ